MKARYRNGTAPWSHSEEIPRSFVTINIHNPAAAGYHSRTSDPTEEQIAGNENTCLMIRNGSSFDFGPPGVRDDPPLVKIKPANLPKRVDSWQTQSHEPDVRCPKSRNPRCARNLLKQTWLQRQEQRQQRDSSSSPSRTEGGRGGTIRAKLKADISESSSRSRDMKRNNPRACRLSESGPETRNRSSSVMHA